MKIQWIDFSPAIAFGRLDPLAWVFGPTQGVVKP
jgi:hypothetical protein